MCVRECLFFFVGRGGGHIAYGRSLKPIYLVILECCEELEKKMARKGVQDLKLLKMSRDIQE
jgi:hypothetical protein